MYLLQVTQAASVSLYVTLKLVRFHKSHSAHHTIWLMTHSVWHVKTCNFASLNCQEVRLICSEGLKRCFVGFVSPRNCLWIQFWPRVSLGDHSLATASVASKCNLLAAQLNWIACSFLLRGLKRCFEGIVSLAIASEYNYYLETNFWLLSQQWALEQSSLSARTTILIVCLQDLMLINCPSAF